MYTYGYIREATMAHLDIDESEALAMNILKRFHIFANEAIQAISAVKPAYKYFRVNIVNNYTPVIETIDINGSISYREATEEELKHLEDYDVADEIATAEYYTSKNIYLVSTDLSMPEDFLSFTNKQSFKKYEKPKFNPEEFVNGLISELNWQTNEEIVFMPVDYNKDLSFIGNTKIRFNTTGEYLVPYKALWYIFKSGLSDYEELNMPLDVLTCIPLYIASQALQIDYTQKAQIKRSEFEMALARVNNTNNMPVNKIRTNY